MNIDRLKHLITILLAVPDSQFDISNWKEVHCGTTACALGWAGTDPKFIAEGFTLERRMMYRPHFDGSTGYAAGAKFFEISRDQSEWLFNPDEYEDTFSEVEAVTPLDVIRRISKLLEDA